MKNITNTQSKIIIEEYNSQPNILSAHLDYPKPGDIPSTLQSSTKVTGWVLTTSPTQNLHIVIKQSGTEKEYQLNTLRPDVIDRLLAGEGKGTKRERCGFSFELQKAEELEIYLKTENSYNLWRRIKSINNSQELENAILAWQHFINNKLDEITEELCRSLKNITPNIIENLIIPHPKILFTPEDALTVSTLLETERRHFSEFITETKKKISV
ncbi:hypothetical protein ACE0DR_24780 [Azotobacter sp. CWF10]